ncbi:secreted seminal-vesicle Ly-6 protein 1-like [Octodon degus]|uniref:Secreted seminal-vesicle Ly-6 protein 1-like n=1 Tax=Octodon degus TaxID=10160 RepID=A0A6P6DCF1_OCTDE|nr:secreted seminal-vesicle Ly-6 protein 1-like [Octodon degus]
MTAGRYLLLLLGIALLSNFMQALTCIQCDLRNADGVCEKQESSCQTYGSQRCFLRKIYDDDKFQYARQGCSDLCIPMALFNKKSKVQFLCCDNASFCNRL